MISLSHKKLFGWQYQSCLVYHGIQQFQQLGSLVGTLSKRIRGLIVKMLLVCFFKL